MKNAGEAQRPVQRFKEFGSESLPENTVAWRVKCLVEKGRKTSLFGL
jgi:hypothetical protein